MIIDFRIANKIAISIGGTFRKYSYLDQHKNLKKLFLNIQPIGKFFFAK